MNWGRRADFGFFFGTQFLGHLMKSVNALFSQWPPSCRGMVRGKWYEEKPSKLPSNCHGNNANRASVLSSKHRYQIPITEDFELLGKTLDEKLKFETRVARVCRGVSRQVAQVYGKDASLWNKKGYLPFHQFFPISTIVLRPGTTTVQVPVQNWKK